MEHWKYDPKRTPRGFRVYRLDCYGEPDGLVCYVHDERFARLIAAAPRVLLALEYSEQTIFQAGQQCEVMAGISQFVRQVIGEASGDGL